MWLRQQSGWHQMLLIMSMVQSTQTAMLSDVGPGGELNSIGIYFRGSAHPSKVVGQSSAKRSTLSNVPPGVIDGLIVVNSSGHGVHPYYTSYLLYKNSEILSSSYAGHAVRQYGNEKHISYENITVKGWKTGVVLIDESSLIGGSLQK